jgi:hypothetical protein
MKMKLSVEANKPRRADCYLSRSRGTNRNKISSFLVCPESAVKKDLEKYLTADKTESFSPLDPARRGTEKT